MLLEDACKQLDLKCVLEGSTSADSGCDPSHLCKLTSLKLELNTKKNYANLLSEMLTYSILTVGNRDVSELDESLREELATTQQNIQKMVNNGNKNIKYFLTNLLDKYR